MSQSEAMRSPIARIYLAMDGHMSYLKLTAPFHGGPVIDQKPEKPQDVAANVRSVMEGLTSGKRNQ